MTAHPAQATGRLLEAAWTASALALLIDDDPHQTLPDDHPAVPLLAAAGMLERGDDGLVLAGHDDLRGNEAVALATIRSSLGQASAIASGDTGWRSFRDEVLLAQGEASAAGGRGFADMIRMLPGLSDAFAEHGVLLDVGVGVAALACAFCEAVPHSRVIGLDVEPRALALAQQRVHAGGLDDRVDLRLLGIEDFDEEAVADLAHMSPVFIPPAVLPTAMRRLRTALRPGGWLVLSGIVSDGADAVTRWMAHHAGGTALSQGDARELGIAAGFADPIEPPLPPGAPRVLVFKAI